MGAWSAEILGNDTSCEVHDRFIELYNLGEAPLDIIPIVLEEQRENIQYDKTNVWFGLALACWECKSLTPDIFSTVKDIIVSNEDIEFCKELDADEVFIVERAKKLNAFLKKISLEKEKPRVRKKPPRLLESIVKAGMCLSYKNEDGNYIGVYVTESQHFRNKGKLEFCFLDFELKEFPSIEMFEKGKLFGLDKLGKEWEYAEYRGNVTSVRYDNKFEKEDFFNSVLEVFAIIGQLLEVDRSKLVNNSRWGYSDLKSPKSIINTLEKIRLETKAERVLSEMTLVDLLEKVSL